MDVLRAVAQDTHTVEVELMQAKAPVEVVIADCPGRYRYDHIHRFPRPTPRVAVKRAWPFPLER